MTEKERVVVTCIRCDSKKPKTELLLSRCMVCGGKVFKESGRIMHIDTTIKFTDPRLLK